MAFWVEGWLVVVVDGLCNVAAGGFDDVGGGGGGVVWGRNVG